MKPNGRGSGDPFADAAQAIREGDFAGAEKILRLAPQFGSDDPRYHELLAGALYLQGKAAEALPHARRAARLAPDRPEYVRGEGMVLVALGRFAEACPVLERAVGLAPGDAAALNALGTALTQTGRPARAESHLRKAVGLTPGAQAPVFNLAVALAAQGKFTEAARLLRGILAKGAEDSRVLIELSSVLTEMGQLSEAENILSELLRDHAADAPTYVLLARIRARQGLMEVAEAHLEKARALEPDRSYIHEELGGLYLDWGPSEAARKAFERALEIDPHSGNALLGLSHCRVPRPDPDLIAAIDEASRSFAGEDQERNGIRLEFARARALDQSGRHREAWDHAVRANARFAAHHGLGPGAGDALLLRLRAEAERARGFPRREPEHADGMPLSIFICGPSRSGKSTLERLIAAAAGVRRGNESETIAETVRRVDQEGGRSSGDASRDWSDAECARFREYYMRMLEERAPNAAVYTNTSMTITAKISRIIRAVPEFLFVFLRRDPWDTALRTFFYDYRAGRLDYAYRLTAILRHIEALDRTAQAWAEACPDRCLLISYEDMVADTQDVLSHICAAAGLTVPESAPPPDDRGCAAPYREWMEEAIEREARESGRP